MNIWLTGMMGTGKSVVGRRLAERLKVSFVDVDHEIVRNAGKSIADIFAADGEKRFRELETAVITTLAAKDRLVVSTGGGALLSSDNRRLMESAGVLICLTATLDTLQSRLKRDASRPLLSGPDFTGRLESLMKERQPLYDLCPIQIATDGRSINHVTDSILLQIKPPWGVA